MGSIAYDDIAEDYEVRYRIHDYPGVRATLLDSLPMRRPCRVLEVGCGTGRWLVELSRAGCELAGIDPSLGMLARVPSALKAELRRGLAETLPWADKSFDFVCFVNSLHHVPEPQPAIREALRVLRPGGRLVSIGLDPHEKTDNWFVYDFSPEALDLDRRRFPSRVERIHWLTTHGARNIVVSVAERIQSTMSFAEASCAGILEQSFTSQLTALTAAEYLAGIQRIREAALKDQHHCLTTNVTLYATFATKEK